jgi:predicted NBD/HSP70 family sugar kinase
MALGVMAGGQEEQGDQAFPRERGSDQSGLRAYNERLVLALVRRHGSLPRADIARSTGLSAQTVSVIIRSLEQDGLLVRGTPTKGRVGQPSVPMFLAADGAYAIGLKIGRRSADLALMDFLGTIRKQLHQVYPYPEPDRIADFAASRVDELIGVLPRDARRRVAGLGIATPFELWNWARAIGAPHARMDTWRDVDLAHELGARLPYPVYSQNDATAACGAELVFGRGADHADFVYFFIGFFIGGGIVLNSAVYAGQTGNAGALGSMPVPAHNGLARQLIEQASIVVLESMLRERGIDPSPLWLEPDDWSVLGAPLDEWIEQTAANLAHAIVASCSVIDFPCAIIDGGFPADVRARIVAATDQAIERLDLRGIRRPQVLEGSVGANARVIGGACLPFFARYLLDRNVLFKGA